MLNYVNLINIHFWIHLVKTTTTTTLKSHHHLCIEFWREAAVQRLRHEAICGLKTENNYCHQHLFLAAIVVQNHSRHLFLIIQGSCHIYWALLLALQLLLWKSFLSKMWVIAAECINLPHIPQNEHHAQVLSDRYGVSFSLNLSSLSQEDISRSVKQTSSNIHFRCALDFTPLSETEGVR